MRVKWYTRSHQKLLSLYSLRLFFKWYIFLYFLKFILIGGKLLYNIVVVLPSIDMNQPWVYMCPHPDPPSHLPPHPIPQGHSSTPALSALSHASNLDWWSISHMIIYTFQCYSLKSLPIIILGPYPLVDGRNFMMSIDKPKHFLKNLNYIHF